MSTQEQGFGAAARQLGNRYGIAGIAAWWVVFPLLMSLPIAFGLWLLNAPLDYASIKTYAGLAILWFMFSGR